MKPIATGMYILHNYFILRTYFFFFITEIPTTKYNDSTNDSLKLKIKILPEPNIYGQSSIVRGNGIKRGLRHLINRCFIMR